MKNSLMRYVTLSFALLISLFILRILEFTEIGLHHDPPADFWMVGGKAFLFDLVFFLKILPWLFIPYLLISLSIRSEKVSRWGYCAMGTTVIIVYAALINYFTQAAVPLGADLFGYSPRDVRLILMASSKITAMAVLTFLLPVAAFWTSLALLHRRRPMAQPFAWALILLGTALAGGVSALPGEGSFQTDFSYNLAVNKAAFFAENSFAYVTDAPAAAAAEPVNNGFKYLNPDYPFLRVDESSDALGEYFQVDPRKPPNIVFILVEGLGRAFSGPQSYLGSFTPFLDTLGEKSLYWENFLASQGRTFASLPSILGSLPFADRGFNDFGLNMPRHFSVLSILKHNGYRTGYFSGEDLSFHNQGEFVRRQNVDDMVGIDDYDKSFQRIKRSTWGYADGELMLKTLQMARDHYSADTPYCLFIQTVSMHTPYKVPGQEKFEKQFEDRMTQLKFDDGKKERRRKYKDIYSSILYTDDALRFFFEEYARLPGYSNTIFFVTGDHRLPEIPMATKIDRYHVPLIVYSPKLLRSLRIASISSHLDIAPSLIAFLRNNYGLRTPSTVTWVGSGLDMDASLRNIHHYPLKHTTSSLHNYISGLYFIDKDRLFTIKSRMHLEPRDDDKKRHEILSELNQYKAMNQRFVSDLKLIPEDLYSKF